MHRILALLLGFSLGVAHARAADEIIFAPDAKLKVEVGDGAGGEGPAWHPKLGVLTTDHNGDIRQFTLDRKSRVFRKGARSNGLLFDARGRLLACEPGERRVTRTEDDGTITVLADRIDGKRFNEPNDLTVDSKGRIYFSDPRYGTTAGKDIVDDEGRIIEGVYRIDPDKKVTRIIGRELERPNGVLVSADDRYLFVADNNNDKVGGARKLYRFDLRGDGTVDVASKKLLHDWGKGRGPDGIKQDAKGRLYVAGGLNKPNPPAEPAEDVKGGIYVFTSEGKLLSFLPVPTDEVTNCAFGGADLKTLYITAGGTLYSVRTTTPGRVVFPRPGPVVPDSVSFEPNIEYTNPDGQHLELDLARPKTGTGPFPAVICIHGGGFRAGSRQGYDGLCIKLAERGYVAVTVSYRLAPKYQFPAAIHDVKAAVRWLRAHARDYHIDPNRIGVTGGSAGGHLAQFLAVTGDVKRSEGEGGNPEQSSRVSCVVNVYGPSDFTKSYGKSVDAAQVLPLWLGGDLEKERAKHVLASPLYWVTPDAAPTLCIHGTDDKYVAHEQAVWIVDRLKAAGVEAELLTLQGAGHGFKGKDAETAEKALFAFFDKHLKKQ